MSALWHQGSLGHFPSIYPLSFVPLFYPLVTYFRFSAILIPHLFESHSGRINSCLLMTDLRENKTKSLHGVNE